MVPETLLGPGQTNNPKKAGCETAVSCSKPEPGLRDSYSGYGALLTVVTGTMSRLGQTLVIVVKVVTGTMSGLGQTLVIVAKVVTGTMSGL